MLIYQQWIEFSHAIIASIFRFSEGNHCKWYVRKYKIFFPPTVPSNVDLLVHYNLIDYQAPSSLTQCDIKALETLDLLWHDYNLLSLPYSCSNVFETSIVFQSFVNKTISTNSRGGIIIHAF
jgi:hypothetical protein